MNAPAERPRPTIDNRIASFLDRRHVDRLTGDVVADDSPRRRLWHAALAVALATPVLVILIGMAMAGVALVVTSDNWVLRGAGVLALLCVAVSLPRPGRDSIEPVDLDAASQFAALLADVASSVGTRAPDVVRIDAELNASAEPRGLRGRVLTIGAPAWAALSGQARVALLAHEIGHFAHRDVLHGRYVWVAYRTLGTWHYLLSPHSSADYTGLDIVASVITAPFRWAILGYLRILHWVNASAGRRQELYADLASARAAGTAGAVDSLETMLMGSAIEVAANRAAVDGANTSVLDAIRARMAAVGAAERSAARTRGADELSAVDRTHPPTIERLRLLEAVAPRSATVVMDGARTATVDAELAPYLDRAGRELRDRYRYVH